MGTLIDDLIELAERVGTLVKLPAVQQVILPPLPPQDTSSHFKSHYSKYSKFGLLILQDGSAGFFYRLLDTDEWERTYTNEFIRTRLKEIQGSDPVTLAAGLRSSDPLNRGLGMAAINAISQYVFKRTGYQPAAVSREAGHKQQPASSGDRRVGMVGFFSPMVAALQQQSIPTTVIELDESLYQSTDTLLVTGDVRQLHACDPIYCTASTLLNDSLETLLCQFPSQASIELIGPTCGCFADPFFARGVDRIGGSQVVDGADAVRKIAALQPWGDSVRKYAISVDDYPGFEQMSTRLRAG